jgi:NCS1 family nucleobase:cation symporter-1
MIASSSSEATSRQLLEQGNPRLTNKDLVPVPVEERNWTGFNFAALWAGMIYNIFGFTVIGGMMATGLSALQALLAVGLASVIQLVFMSLTGRVGTRLGIPFPVWARTAYGVFGANVPAILRGLTAIGWFGIQNYLAATIINALLGSLIPAWRDLGNTQIFGVGLDLGISLLLFWALSFLVIYHGMETIRRFESWAGPLGLIVTGVVAVWAVVQAGGLGPIFETPSDYETTSAFLIQGLVPATVLFMSASWVTLILNYADFTRFARSNREQTLGTAIGFPVATLLFYGMSAIIVSSVLATTGKTLWNPGDVLVAIGNPYLTFVGAVLLVIATLSTNIPANLVSPAYDLTNLFPRLFTFRRAMVAAIIIGFLYMPWRWMQDPDTLFSLLNNVGTFLGPATGILLADYYVLRKSRVDVPELYRSDGRYSSYRGFNLVGLAVLVITTGPIFAGQFFEPLSWMYTYSWLVGVVASSILYLVFTKGLTALEGRTRPEFEAAGTAGVEKAEVVAGESH